MNYRQILAALDKQRSKNPPSDSFEDKPSGQYPCIWLNDDQKGLAKEIGTKRNLSKSPLIRANDSGYHAGKGREFPHILGVGGEIAHSIYFGLTLDEDFYAGGDEFDFGGLLEVKTATWLGQDVHLKVKVFEFERKKPKSYSLARVSKSLSWVEIIGYINREDFERKKVLRNYGYEDNYTVGVSDLKLITSPTDLTL